jgi:hypothetical protein
MALEHLRGRPRCCVPEPDGLSRDADATSLPSGEKATALTEPE